MLQSKIEEWERGAPELVERRWKLLVLLVWLGFCALFIFRKWL